MICRSNKIDTKELRRGNLVQERTVRVWKVTGLDMYTVQVVERPPYTEGFWVGDLLAIPLTDEWLTKAGFTIEQKVGGFVKWENGSFRLLDAKLPATSMPHVQFVHQLQNLYFALTGIELEFRS